MSFGNSPRDASNVPVSSSYLPNTGFIAAQASPNTNTDASGNISTPVLTALAASYYTSGTLQSAQNGNAAGTALPVLGMASVVFTVNMSGFTGTVTFKGSEDNTNYDPLYVTQQGTTTIVTSLTVTTTTSIHLYVADIAGLQSVEAVTSGVSAGTVTVTAHAIPINIAPRVVNINGTITTSNASIGTDGSTLPTSSTLIGASDGTSLQQLLVESTSNRNLRVGLYNGTTEAGITANGLAVQQATGSNLHTVVDSGAITATTNADTTIGGTTAPSKELLIAGKTNDGTPQYQPLPEGAGGRSVIVEGYSGGTAVPVSGTFWQTTQPVSGTVTANAGTGNFTNAAIGATESPIPTSAILLGASDGTNLEELLIESNANPNLRVGLYNGANEAAVDASGRQLVNIGQINGQTPTLDNTTVLAVSLRGQQTTAGDTALAVNGSGFLKVVGQANVGTNIGNVGMVPQTSGGLSDYHLISAATTNAQSIKASAGQVFGYELGNNGASDAWVKLYNKASAPTVGTDTPFRTIYLPKGTSKSLHAIGGLSMQTGIAIAITGGAADADTTAVAASQVTVDVDYK